MTFAAFAVALPKLAQLHPNLSNYSMIAVDSVAPAADGGDGASLDLCMVCGISEKRKRCFCVSHQFTLELRRNG